MKNLRSIKTAMFDCPYDYVSSRDYYSKNLQDKINDTYEWAQNNFKIGQEIISGTLDFSPIVCRVVRSIYPKTGLNRGDDYRKLEFLNTHDKRVVGQRYKFDNQTWITTNTNNYSYSTVSSIVRRCNNQINYINSQGEICHEPCIIDYAMKYSNIYYNNEVNIPQGTIIVILQKNDFTNSININDRFIFGNQVFKVKSQIDYLRNETEEIDCALLRQFDMYVDSKAYDDNMELGIANFSRYKDIYPPKPLPVDGFNIVPSNNKILQGTSQIFECVYYQDGKSIDIDLNFIPNWVDDRYYTIEKVQENSFNIHNNHMSSKPLVIQCISDKYGKYDFNIKLGGLY